MAITLHQLVDQVREELLSPRKATTPEGVYPFLFVEEIELEVGLVVSSTIEGSGKVNIQVIELGSGLTKANEQTHRIKIKMTPLLSKEKIQERLQQNDRLWEKIEYVATQATTKEGGMVGE